MTHEFEAVRTRSRAPPHAAADPPRLSRSLCSPNPTQQP
jgi:hypothetical protein